MINVTLKDLVAINLRYSVGTESYRDMAYGQLAAKALYAMGNRPAGAKEIARDIAQVLGISNVPQKAVERGLDYLSNKNLAAKKDSLWALIPAGLTQTSTEVELSSRRISSLIKRHFPPRIEQQKLRAWFLEACVDFFGKYADHWVAATCLGTQLSTILPADLSDLLSPSIKVHGFESEINVLVSGFREFIVSSYLEDIEQLQCFGMAMYLSRLVAANVAADPVTLELIRNSMVLLDTNVLIALQLEKHRLSDSLTALGDVLATLNINPSYIHRTEEEYTHTLLAIRERMLKAVSSYRFEVVKEAKDAFTVTALCRGCVKAADFERFFDSIISPPNDFGKGGKVTELDNKEIALEAEKGEGDEKLKEEIATEWLYHRKRQKPKEALKHDAALISVARHLRNPENKCFILTLDMPLHNYGIKSAAPQETPISLSLDAMLQILAIGLGGPQMDPAEFGPLMTSILNYQFEPAADAYTIEDLAWLLDIEKRCADLPTDRVQELANRISKARIAGKAYDDQEVRLEVQRAFHGHKMRLTEDLSSAKVQLTKQTEETEVEKQIRKKAEAALVQAHKRDMVRAAKTRLVLGLLGWTVAGVILASIFVYIVKWAYPRSNLAQIIFDVVSIGAPAAAAFWQIFSKVIPKYRHERTSAAKRAEELVREELG